MVSREVLREIVGWNLDDLYIDKSDHSHDLRDYQRLDPEDVDYITDEILRDLKDSEESLSV